MREPNSGFKRSIDLRSQFCLNLLNFGASESVFRVFPKVAVGIQKACHAFARKNWTPPIRLDVAIQSEMNAKVSFRMRPRISRELSKARTRNHYAARRHDATFQCIDCGAIY